MNKTELTQVETYTTKDQSIIRELFHPENQGNKEQSLAQAEIPIGSKTLLHKHLKTEELYHITSGEGLMTLGQQQFSVKAGDTIGIMPGMSHCIENTAQQPLILLCCCSPAYCHQDTYLLDAPNV